jgi:transposase
MFVDDCTYTRHGKTYRRVLLRNSYRVEGIVHHDTLANLSQCADEEIEAIKFGLRHKGQLAKLAERNQTVCLAQGLAVGAVWVLFQLAQSLGLVKAVGKGRQGWLCLWLVFATVIAQGSRLSAVRLAQQHTACDVLKLDPFNEDHLYRAMDWLADQQATIEEALYRQGASQPAESLYLYDVTSSYLEGEHNELGAYGYNRDGKKGKKQIVVGCLTDAQGRPVSIEVFAGNTQDPKTFKSQVDKLCERFGVRHVTLVGDRGMIKSAQIEDLKGVGFHYITAITKPQIEALIKQGVFQHDLFDEQVMEIEHEGVRYVLRRNPVRAKELAEGREEKWHALKRFVDEQNRYLAEHPKAKPQTAWKKVTAKAGKLKVEAWVVLEQPERAITTHLDEENKQTLARLDGCYVIKSDLPKTAADKQTVHDRYKDLTQVEHAFRTMKTTLLEMRGVYVRKTNRTRAHIFIIMLAYLLAYELQQRWRDLNVTVEEGIQELASICTVELTLVGQARCQVIPDPRPLGQQLLERLNITLPDAIPHRGITVATRKDLIARRK